MTPIPLRDDPTRPAFKGERFLERALAAIHFSPVFKIATIEANEIASFQDAIRHEYPLVQRDTENSIRLEMLPDGTLRNEKEEHTVWRFFDEKRTCTAILTSQSVGLEMNAEAYTNWTDFVTRMSRLVDEVEKQFRPALVQRLGVRYLNTGIAEGEKDPRRYCAEELTSITGNDDLTMADLFWRFDVNEGELLLRSGVMPPTASYDPNFFAPRENRSWYLDIDVVSVLEKPFAEVDIGDRLLQQAKRLHAVYYWAVPAKESE
jgi:uncharacterized protein (TIGR04255 family)